MIKYNLLMYSPRQEESIVVEGIEGGLMHTTRHFGVAYKNERGPWRKLIREIFGLKDKEKSEEEGGDDNWGDFEESF